ncbi:LSU ribosomal maturation GTPase RbgA (B. subtilis YlqF) [hydrothermal vent metagenome]|uniref:LSU ribosomal maturation GTPase RbgA (B. subtilis YlqF) n=1 Tax=hydrothermal vent metagenome TaxID=652676 RepID=A0A3B0VLN4_9ZZZZ
MAIQWFPGHMYKAGKEIKKLLPQIDVVIEILDARIPFSSQNPLLMEFASEKPTIKVLNKFDLADKRVVSLWQRHLECSDNIQTIALSAKVPETLKSILDLCKCIIPNKGKHQYISAMIMGIPNVGKSTIINILADRIVAKTGNEPAVTKGQQRIKINEDIIFFDTPGMLWPKIEHENWALRLAITGAIKETAMSHEDIAFYLVGYLVQHYPDLIKNRFEIEEMAADEYSILEQIGKKRGCLKTGKLLDLHKVSSIIIHEYRAGKLGGICLELPQEVEKEKRQAVELAQKRAVKKAARQKRRKGK